MHFLNCLVTDLKIKILNKRPEFSCFPGKSHNIQLWGHGPVHAASFASDSASAKRGSEELCGGKGSFAGRGGTVLADASFFS